MRRTIIATVSLLALTVACPALAQDALPEIAVGADLKGELTRSDPRDSDGDYRYDDYRLDVRAGQRFEAQMRSGDFDAYLAVYATKADGSPETEPRATDDDSLGDGTDARLRFTADRDGVYVLRARSLDQDIGDYTLSLSERPPLPPAPEPRSVRVGDEISGELGETSPRQDDDTPYDGYAATLRQGERVLVRLEADDFDPVLRIGRTNSAGVFEQLAENDDGPDGLNSRLVFVAPESGVYHIRVSGLNEDAEGEYDLKLEVGPPPPPVSSISIGQTTRGRLTDATAENEEGQRADSWRFRGREGQKIVIDMTSDAFDTYLELFRERNGARESLAEDDDSGATGTNSRIAYTLPDDGDYIIEARAFEDGTGSYALKLEEAAPEPPPSPLAFGRTIQGEIGDRDPRDSENRGFDAYAFRGEEGQRVQVILRSGDFDAFVSLGKAGEEYEPLASDDDGLGEGTDARLTFTLPEAGDYVIRTSPLGSDGKGLYSVELIDHGPEPKPGSLIVGATARGQLDERDLLAEDNSYYDAYRIHLKEDDKLRISLVSNDFDAFVAVGRIVEGEYEQSATDDDGLSDTHALLEWTAPEDGEYEIRAGTYGQGETGAYALTVERKP